jgi:thiol-disulfide isomerase/thioredoxin
MKTTFFILVIILTSIYSIAQKSSDNYLIIGDSTNTYKSVDDILRRNEYKNKVVYVDIWGTRCPPCLREFENIPQLKKRFANDSIVFLYLCSPYTLKWDKNNEILWQKIIKEHKLSGMHVLMSAECYGKGFFEKYRDKYTESRLYGIPTYLLVNKKGIIVNFDAPRPSAGEKLFSEIQSLLNQ